MRFFTSKTKKLPDVAREGLLPRKEFIVQGKERFLAAFDASVPVVNARPERPPYVTMFFKTGIGVLAALCVAAGVSAYADTANVPATSLLYPFKRVSENVRLVLAPASEKAQLQATFAVRRANEIAALQTSQPSSTLIPQLTSNLDQDIQSSLGATVSVAAQATSTTNSTSTTTSTPSSSVPSSSVAGPINVYCSAFDVSTSGVLMGQLESNLLVRASAFAQFNEQCGYGSYHNGSDNGAGTSGGPSSHKPRPSVSVNNTTTASTSFDRDGGNHHFDGGIATSTITSTITSTVDIHVPGGF